MNGNTAVQNWARLFKKVKLIMYIRGLWSDMGALTGKKTE